MSIGMPSFPRYIHMDRKRYKELLDPIIQEKGSPFYKHDRTSTYIISAVLGLKYKTSKPIKDPIDVRLFVQLSKEEKWALFTIAIADSGGTDILLDGEKALQIVEGYANGGVQILYDKLLKGDLNYSLENEMIKAIEKAKL